MVLALFVAAPQPNCANPPSVQAVTGDGFSVELLDGTKITGKANFEQIGVETAFGVLKVPVADLVGLSQV